MWTIAGLDSVVHASLPVTFSLISSIIVSGDVDPVVDSAVEVDVSDFDSAFLLSAPATPAIEKVIISTRTTAIERLF